MKTYPKIKACTRLSQSDAMLEAIQAGFFEVFFDKSAVTNILTRPACKTVLLKPLEDASGMYIFAAKGLDKHGIETDIVQGCITSRNNTGSSPEPVTRFAPQNFTVEFSRKVISQLLAPVDCAGLRCFPGFHIEDDTSAVLPTLIVVGVHENGFDIAEGAGYLRSEVILPALLN